MSEEKTENTNMDLWNSVSTTDPEFTRRVNQRGGFTAICAQYQLKKATEAWGPYGLKWGMTHCNYGYVTDEKGTPIEAWVEADFFYPHSEGYGDPLGAQFYISTDIAYKPGNDTRKKLLTDATTKALSKLGFNSDVFEGRFDDNKYVQSLGGEAHVPQPTRASAAPPTPTPPKFDEPPMSAYDEPSGETQAPPTPQSSGDTVKIIEILPGKRGEKNGKPWTLNKFKDSLDRTWSFFGVGEKLQNIQDAHHKSLFVRLRGEESKFGGWDLEEVVVIGPEPF